MVHQIALIGEMEKVAMVSTSRIENIVVKGEDASNDFAMLTIELFLSGSQGEEVSLTWYTSIRILQNVELTPQNQTKSEMKYVTHSCPINENGSAIYTIIFHHLLNERVTCA